MRLFRRGKEHAPTIDLLVAGLGNPGREYERTRHNVGWMVLEELARRTEASWRGKFSGQLAETRLDGARLALVKPETYMNESGRSIAAALRFFKLPPEELLVIHDDVDLDPGRLQARRGGGLAGHNGLRIGVGRPSRGDRRPVADYVLSPFEDEVDVDALVRRAADAVETVVREGLEAAQARFN